MKAAALAVKADSAAATAAKVKGFVEPVSVSELKEALKALKLPRYGG